MSVEEIQEKYNISPYRAIDMMKQATDIVDKVLTSVISTDPYIEARMIIKLADAMLSRMIDMQNDISELRNRK